MNARDLALWTKGVALVEAGTPELLSDDMREVLLSYGGDAIMQRGARPVTSTKSIGALRTKSSDRPITYQEMLDKLARRSS